jgi:flagellar hook-length control protein FliK
MESQTQSRKKKYSPNDSDFQAAMNQMGAMFQSTDRGAEALDMESLDSMQFSLKGGSVMNQLSSIDSESPMDEKVTDLDQEVSSKIPTQASPENLVKGKREDAGMVTGLNLSESLKGLPSGIEQTMDGRGAISEGSNVESEKRPSSMSSSQEQVPSHLSHLVGAGPTEGGLPFGSSTGSVMNTLMNSNQKSFPMGNRLPGPLNHSFSGGEFLSTLASIQKEVPEIGASEQMKHEDQSGFSSEKSLKEQLDSIRSQESEEEKVSQGAAGHSKMAGLSHFQGVSGMNSLEKTEVTAHVVPGAMSQDRLSSDALIGVGNGIRQISLKGGGEMRVKLKPENLGELTVRVFTDGSRVSLKIQASDEQAKKVIEESMKFLKENLSAQNLVLSHVDLSVNGNQGSQAGNDSQNNNQNAMSFQNQQHQQSQQERQQSMFDSDTQWQSSGRAGRLQTGSLPSGGSLWASMSQKAPERSDGRLDVRA